MSELQLIKFTKWLMLMGGAWRLPFFKNRVAQKLYCYYSFILQTFDCTCCFLMFVNFFLILQDKDIAMLTEILRVATPASMAAIKSLVFQTDRIMKLIEKTIDKEKEIFQTKDQQISNIHDELVRSSTKFANTVSFFIACATLSLIIPTMIIALTTESKPIISQFYLPFDQVRHYGLYLTLQIIKTLIGAIIYCISQVFYVTIMTFVIIELKILQHKCRNFDQYRQNMQDDTSMAKQIVEDHQFIIVFVSELNEGVQFLLLFEFLLSSINIATIVFQIIAGNFLKDIVFCSIGLLLLIFQIFALSWYANKIAVESLEISQAVYDSTWYTKNLDVQKILLLVQMRAQKPLMLTLGPFGAFTNDIAVSVIKTAYSFVTIMIRND